MYLAVSARRFLLRVEGGPNFSHFAVIEMFSLCAVLLLPYLTFKYQVLKRFTCLYLKMYVCKQFDLSNAQDHLFFHLIY
jgi:hypothetical protein